MKGYQPPAAFQHGRYVPVKVLGTGTYGQVILCEDTHTKVPVPQTNASNTGSRAFPHCENKKVAVKVAQRDAAYRRSALNEIKALEAMKKASEKERVQLLSSASACFLTEDDRDDLAHFCAVRILDYFEEDGHVCIVTELLQKNVFEILKERKFAPFSVSKIKHIAYNILKALSTLHENGIMHCDIKPENIMLRESAPVRQVNPSHHHQQQHNRNGSGYGGMRSPGDVRTPSSATSTPVTFENLAATSHLTGNTSSSNQTFPGFYVNSNKGCQVTAYVQKQVAADRMEAHMMCTSEEEADNDDEDDMGSGSTANTPSTNTDDDLSSDVSDTESTSSRYTFSYELEEDRSRGCVTVKQSRKYDFSKTVLIDFGAVRERHENNYYDVQSLWYRSPEVLCGLPYTHFIDAFSCGCFLFEIYTGKPVFAGSGVKDQLYKIVSLLGLPSEAALLHGKLVSQYEFLFQTVAPVTPSGNIYGAPTTTFVRTAPRDVIESNFFNYITTCRKTGLERLSRYKQLQQQGKEQVCRHAAQLNRGGNMMHVNPASSQRHAARKAQKHQAHQTQEAEDERLLMHLILALMQPDETRRLSCTEALSHPFFDSIHAQREGGNAERRRRNEQQHRMEFELVERCRLHRQQRHVDHHQQQQVRLQLQLQQQQQQAIQGNSVTNDSISMNQMQCGAASGKKLSASMNAFLAGSHSEVSPLSEFNNSMVQNSFNTALSSNSSMAMAAAVVHQQQNPFFVAAMNGTNGAALDAVNGTVYSPCGGGGSFTAPFSGGNALAQQQQQHMRAADGFHSIQYTPGVAQSNPTMPFYNQQQHQQASATAATTAASLASVPTPLGAPPAVACPVNHTNGSANANGYGGGGHTFSPVANGSPVMVAHQQLPQQQTQQQYYRSPVIPSPPSTTSTSSGSHANSANANVYMFYAMQPMHHAAHQQQQQQQQQMQQMFAQNPTIVAMP